MRLMKRRYKNLPNAKENSNIKKKGKKSYSHKMKVETKETNPRSWTFTQHIFNENGDEYGKWKIKE